MAGVGAGCWALGAGFFVVALAAARSRVRLMESQEEVVRSGEPVPATVSDKGYVIFHESTRIFTAVTFTFTDAEGLQRWVRRTMVVRAENPVINGQQTQLWYDRNDPGNDARIVVKLAVDSPLR
ncbi:hypothetical protein B2J88_49795 [Rhodococcus sp. SRB_17]|nr:hypothetical protein [Rhodococcus sp. SRB_17]